MTAETSLDTSAGEPQILTPWIRPEGAAKQAELPEDAGALEPYRLISPEPASLPEPPPAPASAPEVHATDPNQLALPTDDPAFTPEPARDAAAEPVTDAGATGLTGRLDDPAAAGQEPDSASGVESAWRLEQALPSAPESVREQAAEPTVDPASQPAPHLGQESNSAAQAAPASDFEPGPASSLEPAAEPQADAAAQPETAPGPATSPEPGPAAPPEPDAEPKADAEPAAEAESAAEQVADSAAGATAGREPEDDGGRRSLGWTAWGGAGERPEAD